MKRFKERRNMKVYGMSGYNYKSTPTIMLKGQWLKELGFEIGGYVTVSCESGRLVITPDADGDGGDEGSRDGFRGKRDKASAEEV